ncbi:hypothetical protein VB005_01874 [Metarhizium brunneum]
MPIDEPCQIVFPKTLRVQGRYICAGNDEACKLYKLSHSLNYLIDTNQNVRVERLGVSEKEDNGDGSPATISHCHIFDLVYQSPDTVTPVSFYAKHNEQTGLCSFTLQLFRPSRFSSKKGFNFSRASQSTPDCEKHSDLLFSAVPGKKRDVDYEWRNAERCLLATESDGKDSRSLMLHVKMSTEDRDALVSAWMLRAWWEQTEGNCPKHLDDIAQRIQGTKGPAYKEAKATRFSIGASVSPGLM